jgi:phosphoenolpyruvate carboxykinase (ATP)
MSIKYTRALLNAAIEGQLDKVAYETDPVFGLSVPVTCPGVPSEILMPKNTWQDKKAYDKTARDVAGRFVKNFKEFEPFVSEAVRKAGPLV